jgi:hypothetical protein
MEETCVAILPFVYCNGIAEASVCLPSLLKEKHHTIFSIGDWLISSNGVPSGTIHFAMDSPSGTFV